MNLVYRLILRSVQLGLVFVGVTWACWYFWTTTASTTMIHTDVTQELTALIFRTLGACGISVISWMVISMNLTALLRRHVRGYEAPNYMYDALVSMLALLYGLIKLGAGNYWPWEMREPVIATVGWIYMAAVPFVVAAVLNCLAMDMICNDIPVRGYVEIE